jgi:CRP/FNR family transcriptional regulator
MSSFDDRLPMRPLVNFVNRRKLAQCEDCGGRHQGLCGVLSDEDLTFLAGITTCMVISAGATFIEEGAPVNSCYSINEGHVRLFKSLPDGRRQIIGFANSGHFLGLGPTESAFSAEAMDTIKVCRFNRVALLAAFKEFPALEHRLLEVTMHELAIAQQQMLLLGRKTSVERVATFLLAWAERQNICAPGALPKPQSVLTLPLSRMDLADYLGLTIETVSRSLSQLKRDGLIGIPNIHDIVLVRPQALVEIAEAVQ